jgi:hypothetical protein
MPSKTRKTAAAQALPAIPKELIDQFVNGPMNAEAVNATSMAFNKAQTAPNWSRCSKPYAEYSGGLNHLESIGCQRQLRRQSKRLNFSLDELGALLLGNAKVISCLQGKPTLGLTAKVALQAQCRISRNSPFAVHDFTEAGVRDMQGKRQRTNADLQRLDVVLKQDFPRVDGAHSIFEHDVPLRQSVRVFNQDIKWTTRPPPESQSPLAVDPNVPCAVVLLEVIAWWCPHEVQ